jgi:hypothetical protein
MRKYKKDSGVALALLMGVCIQASAALAGGIAYHVSPSGSDDNPGSRRRPFASLEAARDAVRGLKQRGEYPRGGVTVYLCGGVHLRRQSFELGAADSGQAGAPVVYRSYPGETARLVGGRAIPASAFVPASAAFRDRIGDPAARRHLLQSDLKAAGILEYGQILPRHAVDFGSPTHYVVAPAEVFVDGRPMTLARWPNRDECRPRSGFIDAAAVTLERDESGKPRAYSEVAFRNVQGRPAEGDLPGMSPLLAAERLRQWRSVDDAWFAGGLVRAYAYTQRRIASFDAKGGCIALATPVPLWASWDQKSIYQTFFFNVPEELDVPGEYYIDRKAGMLYLYPPEGWGDTSEVRLSELDDVLVAVADASHVRLSGLVLEATRSSGVAIVGGEDVVLEDCVIRNTGIVGVQVGYGYEGETGRFLSRLPGGYRHMLCTGMESAQVRPAGATALDRKAGRGNGLVRCLIHDTGCGGVLLGGGDRRILESAGNFVRDSEIFRTDRVIGRYAEAVVVDGVGNVVSGNYLHDSDGGILYLHGNDHVIEYNEIARAVKTSEDCGAIEIRQNPSQLGNRIRFNYIHDISRLNVNAHTYAIYLDNESHGVEVFGNVIRRVGGRSVTPFDRAVIAVNGGHNHVIANNLFLDNDGGRVGDGHDYRKTMEIFRTRKRMLEEDVNVTRPPYSTRYPGFLNTYQAAEDTPLYNVVTNNVLVGCGADVGPGRYPQAGYRHHNLRADADSGLADDLDGNRAWLSDSWVCREIPGFRPIPFDRMRRAGAAGPDRRQLSGGAW